MEELLKEILAELKKINEKLETCQKKEDGLIADLMPTEKVNSTETLWEITWQSKELKISLEVLAKLITVLNLLTQIETKKIVGADY